MQEIAPRTASAFTFERIDEIFLGTDDGCEDGSFKEFAHFVDFYNGVNPERRRNIHFISVVGGFYGMNLIPLFRPRELTLFDINPYQLIYAKLIIRVLTTSASASEFLDRLTNKGYDVASEEERIIRENISLKQRGLLDILRSKKSFELSWKYALDNFDLTKKILTEVPVRTLRTGMHKKGFRDYVRERNNIWIYASNIFLFFFFDLEFFRPDNVALFTAYQSKIEYLDLDGLSSGAVEVGCRTPMTARRLGTESLGARQQGSDSG